MSARFPSSARLRARGEFMAVQNGGRRVGTRFMTLLGRPNSGLCDRLGIIASRKLGGAVVRNRAKRRLREIFRRQRFDRVVAIADAPALDLVAIPRRELLTASMSLLSADFQTALHRLRSQR